MVFAETFYQEKEARKTAAAAHFTGWNEANNISYPKRRTGSGNQSVPEKGVDYEPEWEELRLYFARIRSTRFEKTAKLQIRRIR